MHVTGYIIMSFGTAVLAVFLIVPMIISRIKTLDPNK